MYSMIKWYKHFCPIAVYSNDCILGHKNSRLYKIDADGKITPICKLPSSIPDRIKESNRLLSRMFRRDIRTSCITEQGEVLFFRNRDLYCYDDRRQILRKITAIPSEKSVPLNIVVALPGTEYKALWGDYSSNESRKEVCIWGITTDEQIRLVYEFPAHTVRHIHNIVADTKGSGYYIFAGDNDKLAGIYYADRMFEHVNPVFVGKQIARTVQGFCVEDGIIYATDSVSEQNYICRLEKGQEWKHSILARTNGSCIYGTAIGDKAFFSTTVESPEMSEKNKFMAMLSTRRGTGILSDRVEVISVGKDSIARKELEFVKDALPYKLFQYGVVMFPASQSNRLVFYPVGVKKYDGKMGIMEV